MGAMIGLKKNSPILGCLLVAALCACVKVPEYCGNGYELNPETEFCYGNKTYKKCGGGEYNPDAEFCSGSAVYAKCGGIEFNTVTHACDNELLKSKFTVFFELNGGNSPAISPITVDSGAFLGSMFPQTPTRAGYAFDGWSDGTQIYIASSPITKNMTLTAIWLEVASYQVIYDGNGNDRGSAPIDTCSPYIINSTVTVLGEGSLAKNDHTFSGWSTTADGTGPSYTDGNTFTIIANTTLYAKWTDATISTFAVTVSSDGIGAIGSGRYEPGKTVNISAGIAEGKMFKNWTTATSGVIFANANNAITTFVMPANAVTVTAVFEALPRFTVTYNGNGHTGGAVPIDGNSPYYSGSTVTVLDSGTLTKTNHVFNGWSTGASGSGKNYSAGNTFTISKNTTLYAKWTDVSIPTYTVKVSSAGTNASGDGSYEADATVSISAGTPPNGQRFKNWTTNSGIAFANPNNETTTFIMPAKAVEIAANFELITYTVTISSTGIGKSGDGDYTAGATVNISAGTPPDGQRFKNWTTNSGVTFANANNETTTFIMPAKAVEVVAQFEPIPVYSVTVSSIGTGKSGNGNYAAGATVNIFAGTPPANQRFKNWTTTNNGVTFANPNDSATTFSMPSSEVTVTAIFEIQFESVEIGGQYWMKKNLDIKMGNSWCYKNADSNCTKYGRLYDWETALIACPLGWHLPTRDEWGSLAKTAGGTGTYGSGGTAGKKLKATSGWNITTYGYSGNGTNDYGFSALPGGSRDSYGSLNNAGNRGFWWTATEYSEGTAYGRFIENEQDFLGEVSGGGTKDYGFSVRCVQDND